MQLQKVHAAVALVLTCASGFGLLFCNGPRSAMLFMSGAALGAVLAGSNFSFAKPWRDFIIYRQGDGLRLQMWLLIAALLLSAPFLASGTVLGNSVVGSDAPLGFSIVVGAFLYGIGMQFAGGCGCGALFGAGGADGPMIVTLVSMIFGAVMATASFGWWLALPSFPDVVALKVFGPLWGMVASLGPILFIFALTLSLERRAGRANLNRTLRRRIQGLIFPKAGDLAMVMTIGLLNLSVLALAGRPWNITPGFALWGAKIAVVLGFHPGEWTYWRLAGNAEALREGVFGNATSITNAGIFLGAMIMMAFVGRLKLGFKLTGRRILTASAGGVLLGYGSRVAYGGTIGGYYSGVASGSAHAWLWVTSAFAGYLASLTITRFIEARFHGPA